MVENTAIAAGRVLFAGENDAKPDESVVAVAGTPIVDLYQILVDGLLLVALNCRSLPNYGAVGNPKVLIVICTLF